MLKSSALRYSYSKGPELSFPDFEVEKDGRLLVIGKSGSGKTTLLQILAGILPPDAGEVAVGDQSLYSMPKAKRDRFRGRQIGLIFQHAIFIQSLSVRQNLRAASYFAGEEFSGDREMGLLERLSISHKMHSLPKNMSVGEQQRLGIALALVNQPKLILADEPTSALDDENATSVYNLLTEEADRLGSALVIVTHDQRLKNKIKQTVSL